MAIVFVEEKKRKKYLILIFLLILILALFFILRGFLTRPKVPVPEILPPPKPQINFEILESEILKEMELFEPISLPEDKIGRENPFLPY